jgi:hypothetical protein
MTEPCGFSPEAFFVLGSINTKEFLSFSSFFGRNKLRLVTRRNGKEIVGRTYTFTVVEDFFDFGQIQVTIVVWHSPPTVPLPLVWSRAYVPCVESSALINLIRENQVFRRWHTTHVAWRGFWTDPSIHWPRYNSRVLHQRVHI